MKRYNYFWRLQGSKKGGFLEEEDGEWVKYEEIKDYLCCTCLSVLNDKKISQGEIIKKIVREELKELEDRLLTAMTIPH